MPAIAAIDNETLDHLLSVVNDGEDYSGDFSIRKRAPGEIGIIAPTKPDFPDLRRIFCSFATIEPGRPLLRLSLNGTNSEQ